MAKLNFQLSLLQSSVSHDQSHKIWIEFEFENVYPITYIMWIISATHLKQTKKPDSNQNATGNNSWNQPPAGHYEPQFFPLSH